MAEHCCAAGLQSILISLLFCCCSISICLLYVQWKGTNRTKKLRNTKLLIICCRKSTQIVVDRVIEEECRSNRAEYFHRIHHTEQLCTRLYIHRHPTPAPYSGEDRGHNQLIFDSHPTHTHTRKSWRTAEQMLSQSI